MREAEDSMKPGIINGAALSYDQQIEVWAWLQANGVRHHIPEDARIIITGNWIVTPTWDIGRAYNPRYGYDPKTETLKVKTRRYRIRAGALRIPPRRLTKSDSHASQPS